MRALRCTVFVVLTSGFCAVSVAQGEDNVGWLSSIPIGPRIAAESGRLVLVHFWSPSCKPCMRLDSNVFCLPTVGRAIQRDFVPVKMNADFSPTTATQYGVTSLPTDVILNPAGQVVAKYNSPMDAQQYMEQLAQVRSNARDAFRWRITPPPAAPNAVPWNTPGAAPGPSCQPQARNRSPADCRRRPRMLRCSPGRCTRSEFTCGARRCSGRRALRSSPSASGSAQTPAPPRTLRRTQVIATRSICVNAALPRSNSNRCSNPPPRQRPGSRSRPLMFRPRLRWPIRRPRCLPRSRPRMPGVSHR